MEMKQFMHGLLRWWFVPIAAVAIALMGVWTYHRITDKAEAAATVAVLQTYVPPPGEYIPAQIGFDALADSDELAQRITDALADGTTAEQVRGWLSIELKPQLNRSTPSLLYQVKIEHEDEQRAIAVANVAVAEAQELFAEFNTPDARDVRRAFQDEMDTAQGNVDEARAALIRFEADNDAYALTQRREQKLGLVSQLRLAQISTNTSRGGAGGSIAGASLAAAQGQLRSLLALQPEYERLSFEVGLSQSAVLRLRQRVSDLEQVKEATSAVDDPLREARSQLAEAQADFEASLRALDGFQTQNSVAELDGAISSQMSLVNQLTVAEASSAASAGAIQAAIATEEAELRRLTTLEPQYNELTLELQKAQTQLASLQQKVIDVIAGQTLPASAQARLMRGAELQSNFLWTMLTYALGVFLALFASVTTVYVLAYFQKMPPTVEEIERAFGSPVIGRVARMSR